LRLHLNQIDSLAAAIGTVDAQVAENLWPFRTTVEQIVSIPGIKDLGAQAIVSEIGLDIAPVTSIVAPTTSRNEAWSNAWPTYTVDVKPLAT
jgi:hypothetical protein